MGASTFAGMTEMLVPLDGRDPSLRSLPRAARIAARLGLSLRLLTVSDDVESSRQWLAEKAAEVIPGVAVELDVASGVPAEAIAATAGPTTLTCMATAATLRPHEGHVGSVAEEVVRGAEAPVMMIGPKVDLDPGVPTGKVVVPVDGSALSEQALGVAGALASALDVPAWVVTVIPARAEAAAGRRLGSSLAGPESGYVRRVASDLGRDHGILTSYEVLHIEDPAEAILDFAGADGLVVMSTHGRSGLSRLFGGSVALGVVGGAARPVVVMRPSADETA
jgi:nucleotide-binding universal stress UspA family protein